ncbi:Transmembrane and coiled-coil domain-containing protein 6, partial [Haplosporangium sp. Z 767]
MERRTTRSSARAAAAAAAAGKAHPDDDKNTDSQPSTTTQPTGAQRKALYRANPRTAATSQENVTKRIKEDERLRKQRRQELVSAKRFKRSNNEMEEPAGEEEMELGKDKIDSVQEMLKNGTKSEKTVALKTLSDYLSSYSGSSTLQAAVSNQEFLTLLEGILTGTDAEEQLLATAVVTNMAAGGSPELCEAALNTAPHLIQFLDSQNLALVDQSAWALGNIAAEGPTFRDRLKDNGVLAPLIKLLDSK